MTILFYLFISFNIYLYIYLLISGLIRPEGGPFGRSLTLGCCDLKEYVNIQTYVYNPSIQPSSECLVINWMVNSRYGPYHP